MYQYPYGNAQQLNLDWLMEQWQEVKQSIDGSLQGEIDRVEAAITDLLAARDAAVAAAGAANTSAGAAAASAQAAAADAATATAQAAAATQERVNAAQAANNAQSYAGTAQTQAAAAQNAAGQAAASASQAAADASDAHDDALAASGSAVNAAASAAGALQNFQLSDAARQAAQAAEQDAEAAATLLQPPATSADIGKALIVKTVGGGTVTAYELGESGGGGGGGTPAIVNTIEDVAIASFDDGTVNPVQQLVVDIEPVQAGSGDPAPDNVRPITGWTGANVKVSGENLLNNDRSKWLIGQDYQGYKCVPDGTPMTLSIIDKGNNSDISGVYLGISRENKPSGTVTWGVTNGTITRTTLPTTQSTYISIYPNTAEAFQKVFNRFNLMVNTGVQASAFESYTAAIIHLTFPSEAGTVYGSTLTNLGTDEWKLAVGMAIVDLGTLTPYKTSNVFMWHVSCPTNGKVICSNYKTGTTNAITNMPDKSVITTSVIGQYYPVALKDTTYENATVEEMQTAMSGVQLVYELLTPVEYTITTADVIQLLTGYNNIWADTGNINLLQYYADSKSYIDEQDTLVKALIAPVLDEMVADTALTANDFRIVNDTLYRITAPVAAGAALTPNTNCTATTIGAILKTLLT